MDDPDTPDSQPTAATTPEEMADIQSANFNSTDITEDQNKVDMNDEETGQLTHFHLWDRMPYDVKLESISYVGDKDAFRKW